MTWFHVLRRLDRLAVSQAGAVLWNADPGSMKLVGDGINVVFRFETCGAGRYLRVTHSDLRSHNHLASTIDFLQHVFDAGAPVCRPIRSQADRLIEEIRQGDDLFLASVVAEAPGRCLSRNHAGARVYYEWGRSLGRLHQAATAYMPAPAYRFLSWKDLWRATGDRLAADDALRAEYERVDAWLGSLSRTHNDFGLTHGDVRPDNAVWDGRQVSMIDFDEPVYHWFAADIARALREFAGKPQRRRRQIRDWFVAGYRSVRPLDNRWLADLSWFIRMKDLEVYVWTAQHWQDQVVPGGDARLVWFAGWCRALWLANLRRRITRQRA